MAARSGRTRLIRERKRNKRGFRHFLQTLKAVFRIFLTPDNVQLTADAKTAAKHHLLDAKGTLSLLMNDLVRGYPNPTKLPTNAMQAPLHNLSEFVTQLIYVLSDAIENREQADIFDLNVSYSTPVTM